MPRLLATRVNEKLESSELMKPGDFCIRYVPMYNSSKTIYSVVIKCPYCAMDMMSTFHTIHLSPLKRFLSRLGLPFGLTVRPKLACPYSQAHSFSITNGRIRPET